MPSTTKWKSKNCSVCGSTFTCGAMDSNQQCWCNDFPAIMPLDFGQDCRCPECLKKSVAEKIAEFIKTSAGENAIPAIPKKYRNGNQLIAEIDYYMENGQWVFTEWHHLKRGYCCRNGCRHCPYEKAKK